MKLKVLTRRDPQRVVRVLRRELVAHNVLLSTEDASGKLRPNHQDVMLAGFPLVAVILLVNAMKLKKLVIVIGETLRRTIGECLCNRARKKRMSLLQALVAGQLRRGFRSNHKLLSNVMYDYRATLTRCQPFCNIRSL